MRILVTVALICAGLVSVHAQNVTSTSTEAGPEATSTTTTSSETSAPTSAFDLAQLLGLGNGGGNGVNIGNFNFNNNLDIANAIGLLMNNLCIGNLFNANNILALGGNQELELLLALGEINQLVQLGFLNAFDVQKLFNTALINTSFIGGVGGFTKGFNNQLFNFGIFKREFEKRKQNLKRTKLRRSVLGKRQCQVADLGELQRIAAGNGADATTTTSSPEPTASSESTSIPGQAGAEGRRR